MESILPCLTNYSMSKTVQLGYWERRTIASASSQRSSAFDNVTGFVSGKESSSSCASWSTSVFLERHPIVLLNWFRFVKLNELWNWPRMHIKVPTGIVVLRGLDRSYGTCCHQPCVRRVTLMSSRRSWRRTYLMAMNVWLRNWKNVNLIVLNELDLFYFVLFYCCTAEQVARQLHQDGQWMTLSLRISGMSADPYLRIGFDIFSVLSLDLLLPIPWILSYLWVIYWWCWWVAEAVGKLLLLLLLL